MGIFGKESSSTTYMEPGNNNNENSSLRNRRSSASSSSLGANPVSIVPAPSYGKNGNSSGSSSVFGRQQSWSDQLADAALLQNATSKLSYQPMIPSSHNPNIMYSQSSNSSSSSSSSASSSDVKFVHSTMEILENQIKREEAPKKKRTRTSTEQLRILQKAFQTDPMPNSSARMVLSKKLGMSSRAVQVWFQNRRAKEKLDAKRNVLGHSGSSGFSYVKGNSDDSDEERDDEDNYDEDGSGESSNNNSIENNFESQPNYKSSDSSSSSSSKTMLMGRLAFNNGPPLGPTNNAAMKAHRSLSTPNGYFQGNNYTTSDSHFKSMSSSNSNSTASSLFNPLCNLFPGETFISDVNEASVDQLYQDLNGVVGGVGGVLSPIEEAASLHNHQSSILNNNGNNGLLQMSQGSHNNYINPIINNNNNNAATSNRSTTNNGSSFFTFGDPFYGGGIIDRTPSVSPVGFGPRSNFYPIGNGFDFLNFSSSSTSPVSSADTSVPSSNFSNAACCKGPSGGNVYLTSSIGLAPNNNNSAARRSFSLPEAHGNLSGSQMQQLESFGLQVFPSPLLSSINEEDHHQLNQQIISSPDLSDDPHHSNHLHLPMKNNSNANTDFSIPFSEFLEGEALR